MNVKLASSILVVSILSAGAICAYEPTGYLPTLDAIDAERDEEGKDQPKQPDKEKKPPQPPPQPDMFTRLQGPRTDIRSGFTPNMLGDFPGIFVRHRVTLIGTQTTTVSSTSTRDVSTVPGNTPATVTTTTTTTSPSVQTREVLVPSPGRGDFKIAENTSPRPVDRVFFSYNFYGGIRGPQPDDHLPIQKSETSSAGGPPPLSQTQTTVYTTIPGIPLSHVHREVFGFEKTFLDGRASIELRVPVLQQGASDGSFTYDRVGDLRIGGKYAFFLDEVTGDVFSGGLAITTPTGPAIETVAGEIRSTLFQPWIGYIRGRDLLFVQGFHSLVIPTDTRDVTLLFNDVALGLWLHRTQDDRLLRFIVPTAEIHVTTPLNHRGAMEPIMVPDLVVFTGGMHFGIGRNGTFTLGAATPISGPRVFDIEAFAQLNWRY